MDEPKRRTIEVEGVTRSTLVFVPRMRRIYLGLGLCAILLAVSLSAAIDPSTRTTTRVLLGLGSLFFGTLLVLGLRQLRIQQHVALLREGIYADSALMAPRLVRWDTIESIGVVRVGFQRWLGVNVCKPGGASRWSSVLARAGRTLSGWDITYALPNLKGGDALPGLVARYAQEPEARRELG